MLLQHLCLETRLPIDFRELPVRKHDPIVLVPTIRFEVGIRCGVPYEGVVL